MHKVFCKHFVKDGKQYGSKWAESFILDGNKYSENYGESFFLYINLPIEKIKKIIEKRMQVSSDYLEACDNKTVFISSCEDTPIPAGQINKEKDKFEFLSITKVMINNEWYSIHDL